MDNKKILPKVLIISLIIILCGILFRFLVTDTKNYYAVVNNKQVIRNANNKYKYTLNCYDEEGNNKKIAFKTNKKIKNGTYLKLKVSFIRGVVKCEKLRHQKLPLNIKK